MFFCNFIFLAPKFVQNSKNIVFFQILFIFSNNSYILENNDNVLLVEFPAFYDNLQEFEEYVKNIGKPVVGKVFSDHPNGGTIFKNINGTIITNNKFKNTSPSGATTAAFSLKITPKIEPTIIAAIKIIVDL